MKLTNRILKNANITIVADKLHTSFLSASLFSDILPSPQNLIQMPPFGMMDFGKCNFIVDVDNRRVVINHNAGSILDSPVPKMAKRFIAEIKGPEIVAIGFNFLMDLTFDSKFGNYSIDKFLDKNYKTKFGEGLYGVGIKAFIRKAYYNSIWVVEPNVGEPTHAIANVNFHYEMPTNIDFDNEFSIRYDELEEYINGILS